MARGAHRRVLLLTPSKDDNVIAWAPHPHNNVCHVCVGPDEPGGWQPYPRPGRHAGPALPADGKLCAEPKR